MGGFLQVCGQLGALGLGAGNALKFHPVCEVIKKRVNYFFL